MEFIVMFILVLTKKQLINTLPIFKLNLI